jgi:DNA-3-methyladenine glycosylase II
VGLSEAQLRASLDALAHIEPAFAAGIAMHGYPAPRTSPRGHVALLRTIMGQQVSTASANAIWGRLEALIGPGMKPAILAATPDEDLRGVGLSRQKIAYAKSLAGLVASGELDLAGLPQDDEAAIAELVRIKGVGRWSAEIYLLFAEGRPDIWPAGDLAVQIEIGNLLGHEARPAEKLVRELAEPWRPHRGALAIFAWHHYGRRLATKGADKAPI